MAFRFVFLTIFVVSLTTLYAQDTLVTNYPNTDQRWEKIYVDGQKTSEIIYHENESPWMTVRYDELSKDKWKWYHENGNPYFEATIVNDLLQGRYRIWYENGQLAEELFFTDNIENGSARFYYPNGQLSMEGSYKSGKMVGDWRFYDDDGQKATGPWQWIFAASLENIRMEGEVLDGLPFGTWKYQSTANQGEVNQLKFEGVIR